MIHTMRNAFSIGSVRPIRRLCDNLYDRFPMENWMKNLFLTVLALVPLLAARGQEPITEEAYVRADSLLWVRYEQRIQELSVALRDNPDSMRAAWQVLSDTTDVANQRLALRYAAVPSGLQRVFMLRGHFPKDTLRAVLARIPEPMRTSFYGDNIRRYIETRQLGEGDALQTFPCFLPDGTPFDWKPLEGRQVLLIFGGLRCMSPGGRQYLDKLYELTLRDELEIVVFWPCGSQEELSKTSEHYVTAYPQVSDFLQDASPMKILYGAQATPTCFLTDKEGIIRVKSIGLAPDRFAERLPAAAEAVEAMKRAE